MSVTSVSREWCLGPSDPLGLGCYRLIEPACPLTGNMLPLVNWRGPATSRCWLVAQRVAVNELVGPTTLEVELYQRDFDFGPLLVATQSLALPGDNSRGTILHYAGTLCTGWEVRARLQGAVLSGQLSVVAVVDRGFQTTQTVPGQLSLPNV